MKQMVVCICEITAVSLICFFGFHVLFGISGTNIYWDKTGEVIGLSKQQEIVTEIPTELKKVIDEPVQEIRAQDKVYEVGEMIRLADMLQIEKSDTGQWKPLSEREEFHVELQGIWNKGGRMLSWEEFGIWKDSGIDSQCICLGQRGNYTLEVLITSLYGRHSMMRFGILVE